MCWRPQDVEAFVKLANEENLDATVVATVTEDPRLTMTWKGNTIVNISRNFLNSNGAEKHATSWSTTACPTSGTGRATPGRKDGKPRHRPERLQPEGPFRAV